MDEQTNGDPTTQSSASSPSSGADDAPQQRTGIEPSQSAQQQPSVSYGPASSQTNTPFAPATYPGMPGVPLSWAAPTNPPPLGQEAPASTPPVYPGVPSVPLGTPIPNAYPSYPAYPPSYPGYPSTPLSPYGTPLTAPRQKQLSPLQQALAQPFSRRLSALLGVGAVVLIGIAYLASVLFGHVDWADGAHTAGIIALIIAIGGLIVAIVRVALGQRGSAMLALSAIFVLGLGTLGAGGVAASPQIHGFQAQSMESVHNWQGAAHEYVLSGEVPPNAPDVARTLDELGEQQLAAGQYAAAVTTFNTVTGTYGQSGAAVARADTDLFNAYSAWVKSKASDVPYTDAISFLASYRIASTCSSTCASAAAEVEAQALYQYGTSLVSQGDFKNAITQFEAIMTQLPTSSYAAQAHTAAATAYLSASAQVQVAACTQFSPDNPSAAYKTYFGYYSTLSTTYADTPEGKEAKTALAAPQSITGYIYSAPKNPAPTLYLSKTINPDAFAFSNNYRASFDPTTGLFTFTKVAQGTYFLNSIRDDGSVTHYVWWGENKATIPDAKVAALCPTYWGSSTYQEA